MMKRFDMGLSLAVCFAAMIWGAVAHAEPGMTHLTGIGVNSCGQFIAAIGKNAPGKNEYIDTRSGSHLVSENVVYRHWLMGFVSGVNAMRASEQEQVTGVDLERAIWC